MVVVPFVSKLQYYKMRSRLEYSGRDFLFIETIVKQFHNTVQKVKVVTNKNTQLLYV